MSDDIASFVALSEDDKLENFDVSTTSMILRQLGATSGRIRHMRNQYGAAYGSDWLSERTPGVVTKTTRFFKYSITDLITATAKSPVVTDYVEAYGKHTETEDDSTRLMLVFYAANIGRLVATNEIVPERTNISVWSTKLNQFFYITTFAGLYAQLLGSTFFIEEELA